MKPERVAEQTGHSLMVWPCLERFRHLDWLALTSALHQPPQLAEPNQKETEAEAHGKKPRDALGIGGGGG